MKSYKDKVIKALSLAKSVEDVYHIRGKIESTDSINRRTVEGRKLTQELLDLTMIRIMELAEITTPF